MPTVACPDVAVLLHRKADKRLFATEAEALQRHLVACDTCRRRAERLDWIEDGLQGHRHEAPSGFSARVQRKLSARQSRGRFPWLGAVGWVPLAAALAVVAMVAGRGIEPPPPPATPPLVASAVAPAPAQTAVPVPEARAKAVAAPQGQEHRAPRSTLRVQYDLNLRAFPPARGGRPEDPDGRPVQSLRERRRLRHQEKMQLGATLAAGRPLPFAKVK